MSEHQKPEPNKVVQLNPERNAPGQLPLARLPLPLQSLRDQARQQLQGLLREFFERSDDALFDLADKAESNQEQNLYFDSMREVRIRRRAIEAAFFKSLDVNFSSVLELDAVRDARENTTDISVDELSLVKNDELEEMVAVDGMINKAIERFSDLLQPLTLRIDHLVPVKVYQKNNPVAPFPLCYAFADAVRPVRMDVKARLMLFKLFDQIVLARLGELYQRLNQLLIDANILPSITSAPRAGGTSRSAGSLPGAAATAASGGIVGEAGLADSLQTNEVLQTLRALLGDNQRAVGNPAAGLPVLESSDLISLLSSAQHLRGGDPVFIRGQGHSLDLHQLIAQLAGGREQPAAINQVDEDVINLVGMMFEFILEDRNLASPMKALLGRLQIPMVKVAIADKGFFSKGGHPARRLLNEMAMAALGWQEESEQNRRQDNLFARMENMVETILSEFESDVEIFARLLTDFRAWLDKERRRAQILEQRTLDAEDGKAKAEQARAEVNKTLGAIIADRKLPEAGLAILQNAWANVMFITALKHGTQSEQWHAVEHTAEQLVWSLSVSMTAENRRQLLKSVPPLLQQLRMGLESIVFNPFETTRLFKQLEHLHLARLKSTPSAKPVPVAAVDDVGSSPGGSVVAEVSRPIENVLNTEHSADVAGHDIEVNDKAIAERELADVVIEPATAEALSVENATAVATLDEVVNNLADEAFVLVDEAATAPAIATEARNEILAEDDPHYRLVSNLAQGSWFEMTDAAGQQFRCRLAAIIKVTGNYIFVNRSGMKVAEETRSSLALALKNGRLQLLDDGMLFDRALEAVIGSLREQRNTST